MSNLNLDKFKVGKLINDSNTDSNFEFDKAVMLNAMMIGKSQMSEVSRIEDMSMSNI